MTTRFAIALIAAATLTLSTGAALAQMDGPPSNSFYGDPVLPDPPLKPVHVFPAATATQDVAAVTPPAGAAQSPARATPCSALSLCALATPAAHS
jgi:hypothetical protein